MNRTQADSRISSATPVRVLVVEDDAECAQVVKHVLSHGFPDAFKVSRAADLAAALDHVKIDPVDVVLLDLGLPDSQGLETFSALYGAIPETAIVVMTGTSDENLAVQTVRQGAQDYLVKGFWDDAMLVRTVRYAFERNRTQRALAEEHALLRVVMDNIPDQIYLKDYAGRFMNANLATARFFGLGSADELLGKTDFDFFPRELAARFQAEERDIFDGQPCCNREAAVTDGAGNTRWVLTTKVLLHDPDGRVNGLLGINRDITPRKNAEESIRRLNVELEQRVMDRTSELSLALERLAKHDRVRAEFVYNVSHELKTPLTSMGFEIGNLIGGVVGPLPSPVMEYLRMLESDCSRMKNTVADILDLSRLEAGAMKLDRTTILLVWLVRQCVKAVMLLAGKGRIEMVLDCEKGAGFIHCDVQKTARALTNLLVNAIKFTPAGGRVVVTASPDPDGAETLTVAITDTGVGIAPHDLARVTEKYYRAKERIKGTGLGLTIAKEIIELHGGRLRLESPPPQMESGTRVSVTLPVAQPQTILIADGVPGCALIRHRLQDYGYGVIGPVSAENLLDQVRRISPSVTIISQNAGCGGGDDLVLQVKADGELGANPVVAVVDGNVGLARRTILNGLAVPLLEADWREDDLLHCIERAVCGTSASHVSDGGSACQNPASAGSRG